MEIKRVACIGVGLIGHGWATLFAANGLDVTMLNLTEEHLTKAVSRVKENLMFMEQNQLLKPGGTKASLKRIKISLNLVDAVKNADYVQESVPDNYEIKKQVFKAIDEVTSEHTILASSSSGLLMTEIQKVTKHPERCVLAHPMLPVHLIPLIEVVGGEQTSPETVKNTANFLKKLGKAPVVLNQEVSGYIVNRLQAAMLREAVDLVDKGVASVENVDTAFRMGIGIRDPLFGPFLRIHVAGGGIEHFLKNYAQSYSYRWKSMETWTSFPPAAVKKVIESAETTNIIKNKTLEEISQWRDKKLIEILQVLQDDLNTQ